MYYEKDLGANVWDRSEGISLDSPSRSWEHVCPLRSHYSHCHCVMKSNSSCSSLRVHHLFLLIRIQYPDILIKTILFLTVHSLPEFLFSIVRDGQWGEGGCRRGGHGGTCLSSQHSRSKTRELWVQQQPGPHSKTLPHSPQQTRGSVNYTLVILDMYPKL